MATTDGLWTIKVLGNFVDLLTEPKEFTSLTVMIMHYCGIDGDFDLTSLPSFGSWGYFVEIHKSDDATIRKVIQSYLLARPCEMCGASSGEN